MLVTVAVNKHALKRGQTIPSVPVIMNSPQVHALRRMLKQGPEGLFITGTNRFTFKLPVEMLGMVFQSLWLAVDHAQRHISTVAKGRSLNNSETVVRLVCGRQERPVKQ